ncbi:hypothetical protein Tco_0374168, partial [Tanacetum coccineum]
TLENVHNADMFGVHDLDGDELLVETEEHVVNAVTTAATTTTIAVTRPKAKGLVIQEQEQASTPITSLKDKGKGIMVKESLKMKKKYQDKVDTDYELAQRLQAEEQEELKIEEKSKLFQQLLEKMRKHFAAKRAEEKRNRPPTKAQQRSIICTYLKNMAGWKPKDLKTKSFANVQELFDKAMKRENTFVDMDTELIKESSKKAKAETAQESSSKRAGEALEQESLKKQKVDDDKKTEELKQCMELISDDGDDVTIEATSLSTKSPTIMYFTFGKMLKNFNREDLEVLWSIVKARFKKTEPVNYMDIFLHLNLKTMFEHHLEDSVWKNQQGAAGTKVTTVGVETNGSISSSDLVGVGAKTFSLAILSTQGYQQRQAGKTYILMLDENIDMLRLIMMRLSQRWSRISDEHIQVNVSRMGVNEVIMPLDWALRGYWD